MGLQPSVESLAGVQLPASILFSSLYAVSIFSLVSFSPSWFLFPGRYILLNVFLAIAVDNLSKPGTSIDAQKSSLDRKRESQGEREGQEVMRVDIEGPNYTLCAANVADGRLDGGTEEEYCQQQKETRSPQKRAASQRSLFIFLPENKLRRACYKICNNPHFGNKLW